MKKSTSILILTASYGNGHMQVAHTLKQSFRRHGIDDVTVVDLYREAHPGMNAVSRYLYLRSSVFSAYGIDYYGWSYYKTRNMDHGGALAKWFGALGMKRLLRIAQDMKPDAVVSTFPFGDIAGPLARTGLNVPLFTVITDFSLHNRWLLTDSDRFYVATGDLMRELVSRGVLPSKITVSGIPVRERFNGSRSERVRRVTPRSILLMAGAYGLLSDVRPIAESLLAIPDVRIEIICGANARLKQKLERRFGTEPRIRLSGYVDAVHERMRQASCVITKAGGITLSEAIQIGTPILVYKPFSGQERENALYLRDKQAALVSESVEELVTQASEVLDSEELRTKLAKQYEAIAAGPAADTIVQDVLHTVALRQDCRSRAVSDYSGVL